jgi:polyhydroxyalkanoate synthase
MASTTAPSNSDTDHRSDPRNEDREIIDATIDAVTSAVPVGLTPGQMAAATGRIARAAARQPLTTLRRSAALGADYVKIASGTSEIAADRKDRRFTDDAFDKHPLYKRLAQAHLAGEQAVDAFINELDLDDKSRLRAEFVANLVTSTTAPTNTLAGNPAALRQLRETKGRSLVDGVRHALHDARHNGGLPSMVDTRPFVPGETVAATPGAVVFSNPVLELIQYTPTTKKVAERPVFIIPPQINKYYILDLAPQRSLIEHLVANGQQVFAISFRNPTAEQRDWGLDTYVAAILEATDAAIDISGSPDLNLLGVCAGGITMAAMLGHLATTEDTRIHSATFLVTILDWEVPSTLGTFISRPIVNAGRRQSQAKGILDGADLGRVFAWLRPNDLIWNYWVNNYLMGKNPAAFDVLSWNVDSTNLPAALHSDFLEMAVGNTLAHPGETLCMDTPVDLSDVTVDSFVVGAVTDHITPWRGCYPTVNLLGGNSEFVLSSQGHIQALVNPSGNPKGSYHTNKAADSSDDDVSADEWLAGAEQHQGSWWDHWLLWLGDRSGKKVAAPAGLGNATFPAGAPAPGTYVFD